MQPKPLSHNADEVDTAGRTLFGEARGEPFVGRVAVAWVIRNRVERPGPWGRGIVGVCLRPKQFSCWNSDDANYELIRAVTPENPRFRAALAVATLVFMGDLEDPTDGATNYWTHDQPKWAKQWPPSWSKDLKVTARLGAHVFAREPRAGEQA